MDRLEKLRDSRLDIAKSAAKRWAERTQQRDETLHKLDQGGATAANSPESLRNFEKRVVRRQIRAEALANIEDRVIERVIGKIDFTSTPATPAARSAGLSVGRIVEIGDTPSEHQGFGTGFMIAPRLMLTNHHVFESAEQTFDCGIQFGYETARDPNQFSQTFELVASEFFLSNKALDYAIVAVKPLSLENNGLEVWAHHELVGETGKILKGHPLSIIQHPDGGPKRYAATNNNVVDLLDNHLHYTTDTRPGSSGSPGFNDVWEVVALHRSGVPAMDGDTVLNVNGQPWHKEQGDNAVLWVANEGVRISRILEHVETAELNDPRMIRLRDSIFNTAGAFADDEAGSQPDTARFDSGSARGINLNTLGATDTNNGNPVIHIHGNATINFGSAVPTTPSTPTFTGENEANLQDFSTLERKLRRDPDYSRRRGYDEKFLSGFDIDLPSVISGREEELVDDRHGNPVVLDYHHFSLVMNQEWRLQMWCAANVDYSPALRSGPVSSKLGSVSWIPDERILDSLQIEDDELYFPAKKFDQGHMVSRHDNAWGATLEEREYAVADTYHWTNCTPQHEDFNQAIFGHKGVWGRLERHIAKNAKAIGNRLTVFAGPVLDADREIQKDFGGGLSRIPLDFWKVLIIAEPRDGKKRPKLKSYGFLLSQEKAIADFGLERVRPRKDFDVKAFEPQQRTILGISKLTGVVFAEDVIDADVMDDDDAPRLLASTDQIKL